MEELQTRPFAALNAANLNSRTANAPLSFMANAAFQGGKIPCEGKNDMADGRRRRSFGGRAAGEAFVFAA
jgi:hypothetical protein